MELEMDQLDRILAPTQGKFVGLAIASARAACGVAAAALNYPPNFDGPLAAIEPGDLTDAFARDVFVIARKQYESRGLIDLADLYSELSRSNRWDRQELLGQITGLIHEDDATQNAEYFVNAVRKLNALRGLAFASAEISQRIQMIPSEEFDPQDLASEVFQMIDEAVSVQGTGDPVTIEKAVAEAVDVVKKQTSGEVDPRSVPVGFKSLAVKVPSFKPGQFIIVGARPSVGKTSLGISFALSLAHLFDKPAYFASLEMSAQEIGNRVALSLTNASGNRIRNGIATAEDLQQMEKAVELVKGNPLFIDDKFGLRIDQIYRTTRRIKRRHGLNLIVADYLQLVETSQRNGNRREAVEEVSRSLKRLARELQVPVIAMAQLNREVENRPDPQPRLSDLREAGGMEQDADIVLLMWRLKHNRDEDAVWQIGIDVAKHRNGPTGDVTLNLHRASMTFSD